MRRRRPFRWDLLLKVGGSLGRGADLRPLMQRIALLARRRRLLVLPGGGAFADLVRAQTARQRLDEKTAHHMALLAMDQYGLLLSSLTRRSTAVDNLRAAELVAESGRVPVLLASSWIQRETSLERSVRLTSDSIAAFIAGRLMAANLVLLKSVTRGAGRIPDRAAAGALARRGVVDPLFSRMLPSRTAVWVLRGHRLSDLDRFMPPIHRATGRRRIADEWSGPAARLGRSERRETI